jgi:hypothetical protein
MNVLNGAKLNLSLIYFIYFFNVTVQFNIPGISALHTISATMLDFARSQLDPSLSPCKYFKLFAQILI